jgi:hypothetical protein
MMAEANAEKLTVQVVGVASSLIEFSI